MEFIDKIYVINLDKAKDRWDNCIKQFEKYNIENYERLSASLIDKLSDVELKYLNYMKKSNPSYILGSYGCRLSHIRILEKYINCDDNLNILVLEDDFVLKDNFLEELEKSISNFKEINNWENYKMLYLGSTIHKKTKIIDFHKNIKKIIYGYGTYAYMFNSSFANDILEFIHKYNMEIDKVYCLFQNKNNIYLTQPSVITHIKEGFSFVRNRNRITTNLN